MFEDYMEGGTVAWENLEAWAIGAEPIPMAVARQAEKYGVPLKVWPRIEAEYPIPSLGRSRRGIKTEVSTTPESHARRVAAITKGAHARSGHPFLAWLGDKSVATWAKEQRLEPSTVQSYLRKGKARRSPPIAFRALVAHLSDGAVPVTAWD